MALLLVALAAGAMAGGARVLTDETFEHDTQVGYIFRVTPRTACDDARKEWADGTMMSVKQRLGKMVSFPHR